ncbi:MAG TPA: hypothetical protein VM533_06760, partial [Fimbriiglobus sp.]|nr:hypothetical protein [Fimbriiglobus sp.]
HPRRAVAAALALGGPAAAQPPADKYKLDTDRFQFTRVEDDAPVRAEDQNREEYEAYNDVLLHARQFTATELEAHAYRDVTFRDLVRPVRRDYQFKLLYFEGRLAQLRRGEPNKRMTAAGLTDWYEGWMFPVDGSDPMCVHITELPPGLTPSQKYDPRPRVVVAGYYFKMIRYESSEKTEDDPTRYKVRRAPLLLAKSFTLLPDAVREDSWQTGFLPGMLGVLAGVAVVVTALTLLFRRGDRAARRALEHRRDRNPFDADPANPER